MVASDELLPAAVLRQIGDKLYEKRKLAALDVEQLIKRLAAQNDQHRIRLIIEKLISEYAFSSQPNHRKVCKHSSSAQDSTSQLFACKP